MRLGLLIVVIGIWREYDIIEILAFHSAAAALAITGLSHNDGDGATFSGLERVLTFTTFDSFDSPFGWLSKITGLDHAWTVDGLVCNLFLLHQLEAYSAPSHGGFQATRPMHSNNLLPVTLIFWPEQVMQVAIASAKVPDIMKVTFLDLGGRDRGWCDLV